MSSQKSVKEPRKRAPRLGRGLSSLMATPVSVQPDAPVQPAASVPPDGPDQTVEASPSSSRADARPSETQIATPGLTAGPPEITEDQGPGIRHIAVDQIVPNRSQPRHHFEDTSLRALAESIRADGLMQPIIVRPAPEPADGPATDRFELVAGERRWRAAQLAGLASLPAIVHGLDDRQLAEWALIENVQREDLNPIEKARAIEQLIDRFKLSHQEVGQRLGMDRSYISNLLRLLVLDDSVQDLIGGGLLSMGQARALAGLSDLPAQSQLARKIIKEGWSVRQTEAAVRKLASGPAAASRASASATRAPHFADLERQITDSLGTRVAIRPARKKGAGTLTIEFYSLEQFDSLLERMSVTIQ